MKAVLRCLNGVSRTFRSYLCALVFVCDWLSSLTLVQRVQAAEATAHPQLNPTPIARSTHFTDNTAELGKAIVNFVRHSAANARIREMLEQPMPMHSPGDTPLADVLKYIQDATRRGFQLSPINSSLTAKAAFDIIDSASCTELCFCLSL